MVGSGSVVYYELLKPEEKISADRYKFQLTSLSQALKKKQLQLEQRHDEVIIQDNSGRPLVAKSVKTYLGSSILPGIVA